MEKSKFLSCSLKLDKHSQHLSVLNALNRIQDFVMCIPCAISRQNRVLGSLNAYQRGHAMVAKGVTKLDVSLPEIGLKDVIPNGSWLEQKQIQTALESRKDLIEVERIQKFGTLSHATWREDLKLAEVTQQTGSHWQYLGHNIGKKLYLKPEEALFLMEVNSLLLKHNDVTVSLQKAYSLLLNEITFIQYRVYASLSRLGYKIFKHKGTKKSKEAPSDLVNQTIEMNENMDAEMISEKTISIADQIVSAVPTLDSKPYENNLSQNKSENVRDLQKPSESNIKKTHQMKYTKENNAVMDNNESNSLIINNTIEKQSLAGAHIDNPDKSGFKHETESMELDSNKVIMVENTGSTNIENIEYNDKTAQDIKTKIEDTAITDTNVVNTTAMDVDAQEIRPESYDKTLVKTENQCDLSDIVSSVINESNAENDDKIVEDTKECKTDNSYDGNHVEPMDSSSEFQITNSSFPSTDADVSTTISIDLDTPDIQEINSDNTTEKENGSKVDSMTNILNSRSNQLFLHYVSRLRKLTSQHIKPSDYKTIAKNFENIPDLFKKEVVSINAPDQQYIPKNIYVNSTNYLLKINEIRNRSTRSVSSESPVYNISDEVNGSHIRRIRNTSNSEFQQNLHFVNNIRFPPRHTLYFRPFNFWRPQNNLNYVSFNMFFQRPFLSNMYFHSRLQYQPRPNSFVRSFSNLPNFNVNSSSSSVYNNNRKRLRSARNTHLQSIINLSVRLKQLIMSGHTHVQNIESLHRLLYAYNNRYKARLRLNNDFEIVNDETIVETIELGEDDESKSKRPRLCQDLDNFNENLNKLRELALKLKDLEDKNKSSPKHKRALSKAIKVFNKSYEADIYMNKEYEIIDKRFIEIASDSESDCLVAETKAVRKRKKLKNPFYILKQLSEKRTETLPGTSRDNIVEKFNANNVENTANNKYSEHISNTFSAGWLPEENDFGRAEVVNASDTNSRQLDSMKDEYLYSFIKNHGEDFNNWLEAKLAFLQHMEESDALQYNDNQAVAVKETINTSGLRPLIDEENVSDVASVLEKLRIIQSNNAIDGATSLSIHFDVYNRDVQNFKKTNPPKPHFRIICLGESSNFPSAAEVMALQRKYEDNVPVVFALVGISSISYLQINMIDLPVYLPGGDLN